MSPEERFESKFTKTDGCWIWRGNIQNSGYGNFQVNYKTILAHRFAYEFYKEKIPKGKGYHGTCVMHTCDNRACVNPDHLRLGTQKDNMVDMATKGRSVLSHGKLAPHQVVFIRKLDYSVLTMKEVGDAFGVSGDTISDIIKYKTWTGI